MRKDVSLDDSRKAMLDVIEGVAKEPPSKSEVDRIRTKVLKDMNSPSTTRSAWLCS